MLLQDKGNTCSIPCLPNLYILFFAHYIVEFKTVLYFLKCISFFQDLGTNSCKEAENSSCRSDMLFLSREGNSNTEGFDVSQSPITNFHYQERYQQGRLAKVSSVKDYKGICTHLVVLFPAVKDLLP